jgi:ribosomal protein S18 acetylase RimI-like enzyme
MLDMPSQTPPSVILRPAAPDDAEPAAALIYETAGTLGDYVFGTIGRNETVRVLAVLFRRERHLFSYDTATLAVSGGEVVGIVQAMPGADLLRTGARLVREYARCYGWRSALRLAGRAYPLAFEPDAKAGEYYVETLAVAPSRRNQGIGGMLLAEAQRRGRQLGFTICSLSVMLHNTDALRFYRRMGFHEDLVYRTRLRAPDVQYTGFYRMIKSLPDPSDENQR